MNSLKSTLAAASTAFREISSSEIFQQAGWLAFAKIAQGVGNVVATLAIARHLGPAHFGQLSLAIAVSSFVAGAATLGLEQIATRELASAHSPSPLRTLRSLRFIGAIVGSGMLIAASRVAAFDQFGISALLLIVCWLPLAQIGDLAEWQLIARGSGRKVASIALALAPVAVLTRLCFVFLDADVATFAWILVAEWCVRSCAMTFATRGAPRVATGASREFVRAATTLLRDSLPLLAASIAVFVYMRIDQFMIAAMLGPSDVGIYSAVVTLAEAPLVLPVLLLRAALPTLSQQSRVDSGLRDRTLAKLMAAGFYVHVAIALALVFVAEPVVVLLYGEAYRAGISAFRLQVLSAPFVALGVLSSAWLVLQRCTGHAFRRTLVGALANIALNLVMIPRFGIAGAAGATLIAQVMATYVVDALHAQTRELFSLKTRALLFGFRRLN